MDISTLVGLSQLQAQLQALKNKVTILLFPHYNSTVIICIHSKNKFVGLAMMFVMWGLLCQGLAFTLPAILYLVHSLWDI